MINMVRTDGIAREKMAFQIGLSRNNASFPMIVTLSFVKKNSMLVETAPVKEPMPFCVTLCRKKRGYRFLRGSYFHLASEYPR